MQPSPEREPDLLATGKHLLSQGQVGAAREAFQQALGSRPDDPQLHFALGDCAWQLQDWPLAQRYFERVTELEPENVQAWINLSAVFAQLQDAERAWNCVERVMALAPWDADLYSSCLVHSWTRSLEPARRFALFRRWDQLHALPHQPADPHYPNRALPERRLRVGYVSGEFRVMSATLLFLPLFQHADRAGFEIFAYNNHPHHDRMTALIRQGCDHFRQVESLSDPQLADQIRADGIDLLVDLSGHTRHHRLGVFARRPAPLQFTGLGFVSTTGLSAIQYRFTDAWVSPPELQAYDSEKPLMLPSIMHWQPVADVKPYYSPELPAARRGGISFGCLNPPFKLNQDVLALWARILAACPGSRLLFKSPGFESVELQRRYRALFAAAGVEAGRLEFFGKTPLHEHLAFHQQLDLGLDPFPYQGGITSCETLAMGVPLLSLNGGTGTCNTILGNMGLAELIAPGPDAYFETAVALAGRQELLQAWRRELPFRLFRSAICDSRGHARAIEAHYRVCWREWCQQAAAP